jgi:ribosomal protein L37AE/L43A
MSRGGSNTIRSSRDFLRRYFPRRYREKYIAGRPPAKCPRCGRASFNWSRARWGAWLCKDCGTCVLDEERA